MQYRHWGVAMLLLVWSHFRGKYNLSVLLKTVFSDSKKVKKKTLKIVTDKICSGGKNLPAIHMKPTFMFILWESARLES